MTALRTASVCAAAVLLGACAANDGPPGGPRVGAVVTPSSSPAGQVTHPPAAPTVLPTQPPDAADHASRPTRSDFPYSMATCTADDLTVAQAEADGAGGNEYLFVSVRNTSPTSCRLSGRPGLRDGPVTVATTAARRPAPGSTTTPARLAPGMAGQLTLTADNQLCRDDPDATYTHHRHLSLAWGEGQALPLDHASSSSSGGAQLDSCAGSIRVSPWYAVNHALS